MPGTRISSEEEERIIKTYKETEYISETSRIHKRSYNAITRVLDRHNIQHESKLNELDIRRIKELYLENNSLETICRITGFGSGTVHGIVKVMPEKRDKTTFGKVRFNPFAKELEELEAYTLGLLISDGCVSIPNKVALGLHLQDTDVLEIFASCFKLDNSSITICNSRPSMGTVKFSNSEVFESLKGYGIIPNKIKTTYLPILNEALMPHLIRGIFDGDGHVSKYSAYISGSESLIKDLSKYFHSIDHYTYLQKNTGVWYIKFKAKKGRRDFLNYMYNDASLYMKRKYNKYLEYYGPG